jgi:hypothetical protein
MENRNTKRDYLVEKLICYDNPKIWEMMQTYGHAIVSPVPSYFYQRSPHKELPGVAQCNGKVKDTKLNRQVLY